MGLLFTPRSILIRVKKDFPYDGVNFKQGDQLLAKTVSGAEDRWHIHYENGTFISFVDWLYIDQWKVDGYVSFDL